MLLAQLGHTWTCAPSLLTAAPRTAAGRTGHAGQHLRLENLLFGKQMSQFLPFLPGMTLSGMSAARERALCVKASYLETHV